VAIAFLLGSLTGFLLKGCQGTDPTIITERVVETDTVIREIHHEPLVVEQAPAEVVYIPQIEHDTVFYETPAFVASLDTVIQQDTLEVDYAFPQHTFSVMLRQQADSIETYEHTVYITRTEIVQRPLWVDILSHTGAIVIGYGAGSLR